MNNTRTLLTAVVSRKLLIPTIIVLLGMAFLARLGFWQLDRLAERRASNAALLQALESQPIDLAAADLPHPPDSLKDRDVVVSGTYDFSGQILLKAQNWGGRPGYHLVTPLRIAGSDAAVLVDRGWIPEAEVAAGDLSRYDRSGEVTVNGYLALSQTITRNPEASTPAGLQLEWYRVDIEAIQGQISDRLLPIYVMESPNPDGDSELPFRIEREVDLSEGPHMGYAVQWFIFTLMLGVIYLVYVNRGLNTETD